MSTRILKSYKDTPHVSSDWFKTVENRFVYLNNIYTLLERNYPKEIREMNHTKTFELSDFRGLLDASEAGTAYQKWMFGRDGGLYVRAVEGLKITADSCVLTGGDRLMLCQGF